jgi:hypothetical protein
MDHVHIVVLSCHHCAGEHLHEVTYAGRLLASTVCSNCGHRIAKDLTACAAPTRRRRAPRPDQAAADAAPGDPPSRDLRPQPAGALLVKPAKMEAELPGPYGRR